MPDLQEISQDKLIRSNIGVLCNVREDHLAEMGPTLDDVARSLSRTMPVDGVCVTAERERLPLLRREAARRGCKLLVVRPESVTDEEMAGFSWITFKENVAIALAVAELLGVNRQLALAGMWSAPPDPGVLEVKRYRVAGKLLRVANVFAANDPQSTLMNVQRLLTSGGIRRPLHLVINCRPDRVERNGQMGALVADLEPERVVLIGTPTRSAKVAIPQKWQDTIVDLGGTRDAPELVDEIVNGIDEQASLVAIGNIHGQGELLLEQLDTLPVADPTAVPEPRDREQARPTPAAVAREPQERERVREEPAVAARGTWEREQARPAAVAREREQVRPAPAAVPREQAWPTPYRRSRPGPVVPVRIRPRPDPVTQPLPRIRPRRQP
jgi:poly-gamma-glutamate synthase PgsB/CapB